MTRCLDCGVVHSSTRPVKHGLCAGCAKTYGTPSIAQAAPTPGQTECPKCGGGCPTGALVPTVSGFSICADCAAGRVAS